MVFRTKLGLDTRAVVPLVLLLIWFVSNTPVGSAVNPTDRNTLVPLASQASKSDWLTSLLMLQRWDCPGCRLATGGHSTPCSTTVVSLSPTLPELMISRPQIASKSAHTMHQHHRTLPSMQHTLGLLYSAACRAGERPCVSCTCTRDGYLI